MLRKTRKRRAGIQLKNIFDLQVDQREALFPVLSWGDGESIRNSIKDRF